MITSTLRSANAARRRMRGLARAVDANPPVRVAASRLPPHTTRAFDELRGARAHAIALVVLAVHCTVALQAWRVSVENQEYTAPRALDLQFDVGAAVPSPAAISKQPAARAGDLPPAMRSSASPPAISPRRARDSAGARNTAPALPSKPPEKTAPNKASKWQPAPSPSPTTATAMPQPTSTKTEPEPVNAPTAKSPDVQPAQEPLTEPSFGAAYLRNPPPTYPGVAQQRGWQGTVLLKVHVLASGHPDHVGLASSSGHESLDDAAREAVTNWRFAPARRGDQAIDGWVQVPIEFKLGT
ncbi:hypothetical protein R70006_05478 [Paraburkholderia domus]|jgi:TonB family C-terminal domain|uniref:TonB C-terminal domain-containing protein n=2 Tax=Paraburkholderia domus TaxID=2793075 RepID=A0A9N8N3G1_9BURK|nr:hypothetical protein R70006_05478 [Paraburkholderia domus]CAE6946318.1 hypothetical protein R70211_05987 [Paraburkholderia domus]